MIPRMTTNPWEEAEAEKENRRKQQLKNDQQQVPPSPLRKAGNRSSAGNAGDGGKTATANLTQAGKRILASESEGAKGRISGAFSSMMWSLKNVVLTNILNTSAAEKSPVHRARRRRKFNIQI